MENTQVFDEIGKIKPITNRMPLLFLGHGSPMNAIEENQFVEAFRQCAVHIPKPESILCISAHWFVKGAKVTALDCPKTIHDFGGFPKALYDVNYPAPGNPTLAKRIKQLLAPTEVELDRSWGLDHGTWSVVKHLYPNADIPVVQLSLDFTKQTEHHFEMGAKLAALREEGVLIIGSGNIIHNMRLVDYENIATPDCGFDWAIEAKEMLNNALLSGDTDFLLNYKMQGDSIQLAIPTPDHFLPLLYILAQSTPMRKFNFLTII